MASDDVRASPPETAALIALVRGGRRPPAHYSDLVEEAGSAHTVLSDEQGMLTAELIAAAREDLARWSAQGMDVVTVLDPDYPENLRTVHDRPPLIFVAGELKPGDARAVAVIGSRRASTVGIELARAIGQELVEAGYAVVSGLAAGIDTAAHGVALEHNVCTIAVIGTGLSHCYPPANASLQRQIAARGAVISRFWPEDGPSRHTFPARNAVMSGLALATVIVEASETSGARIQARQALAHGRPVLLVSSLLARSWARELSRRPGAYVVEAAAEVVDVVERAASTELPVA